MVWCGVVWCNIFVIHDRIVATWKWWRDFLYYLWYMISSFLFSWTHYRIHKLMYLVFFLFSMDVKLFLRINLIDWFIRTSMYSYFRLIFYFFSFSPTFYFFFSFFTTLPIIFVFSLESCHLLLIFFFFYLTFIRTSFMLFVLFFPYVFLVFYFIFIYYLFLIYFLLISYFFLIHFIFNFNYYFFISYLFHVYFFSIFNSE